MILILYFFLQRSFIGKEKLYKVWWFFGLPMFLSFYASNRIIVYYWLWSSYLIVMGFFFVTLALMIFWWICAWRCAPNVENWIWMYSARVFIVLQMLYYSNKIRIIFF